MLRTSVITAIFALMPALPAAAQSVLSYHNGPSRDGRYVVPGLTLAAAATMSPDTGFSATISGNVHAQPLYWQPTGGQAELIVATENNTVYALNPVTGAVIWQQALPPSAPLSALGCGDINPEGILGTPVIAPGTATIFLNAVTYSNGTVKDMVYALSLGNGAVLPGWPIDVQAALSAQGVSFSPKYQGERGGALLFEKNVYIVYGGRDGDCGSYNGTVIQVDPASHSLVANWQTRAVRGGIWAQAGIASDLKSMFVTTGNTSPTNGVYGDGESVIRLKPGLAHSTSPADYYAPQNWLSLDDADLDLGGSMAVPLIIDTPKGRKLSRMLALGKDGNAYLLDRANLGGIGGAATISKVSNTVILTAPAVYTSDTGDLVAFTNRSFAVSGCSGSGIMSLKITATKSSPLTTAWCAQYNGDGSAIVTTTDGTLNPIVWVVGAEGDNELHGFNALTGATVFTGSGTVMSGLHHFQTFIAAAGRFYVAADNKVYAFKFTGG